MKFRSFVGVLALLLVIAPSAFAGTLVSGSQVSVASNYEGFSGLSLVGTWSTTPAVSDQLVITNALLPAPYGLKSSVNIDIPQPTIQSVFRVTTQKPLQRLAYIERSYNMLKFLPTGNFYDRCGAKLEDDVKANYGGKEIVAAVMIGYYGAYCKVSAVIVDSQAGWIGTMTSEGLYYDQTVNLNGVGTLHLYRNSKETHLVDKINGVGRATLLGFDTWTSAQPTSQNLYGYSTQNVLTANPSWSPFTDTAGLATYNAALARIYSAEGLSLSSSTDYAKVVTEFQAGVQQANNEVARLVGASGTLPAAWSGKVGGTITKAGNDVAVPLVRQSLTANIQLVLAGEKFGLIIPTGKPSIVTLASSLKFDETSSGTLAYTVKNTGSATGTFVIRGSCPGNAIVTDENEISIPAGQQVSGKLTHTAKSQTLAKDETYSCTFTMTETNTQEKATKAYFATVVVKTQCAEGQESDPVFDAAGQSYSVYVYDSYCQVKTTKTCALTQGSFVKKDGKYECSADGKIVPQAPPSGEKPKIAVWLLVISLVISCIAGGFAAFWIVTLTGGESYGWILAVVAFLVIAIGGTILIGLLSQFIGAQFSFSQVLS